MIKILFFGQLREQLDCQSMELELGEPLNVTQLKQTLLETRPQWTALVQEQILCAVNQTLCGVEQQVKPGDEVAFFPPVTGG